MKIKKESEKTSKLSCSFTLGKLSAGNSNIEHNNREFISKNVDVTRVVNNITYIRENARDVYDELFADSLAEYNAKQKRNDRRIDDYFSYIKNGSREEAYYEIIVQFGDVDTAKIGSKNGDLTKKMLDEYMFNFQKRNPNLRVFNSTFHADETTNHLHINFVPFYTEQKKIGMSKGVSLKSALIEQGFVPQGMKQNQLVMWEESEMLEMERILQANGLHRDVKNATHQHQSVPDYKAIQDWRKLPKRKRKSTEEFTQERVQKALEERALLQVENAKLIYEKQSDWRSFYYSSPEKLSFMIEELDKCKISIRGTDTGFDAQSCYLEKNP